MLGVGRRHFFVRDRDALLLAALLSALLHFALLKSLMGYRTAPASSAPAAETEIALVPSPPIENATPQVERSRASSPPPIAPERGVRPPPAVATSPAAPALEAPGKDWVQSRLTLSSQVLADPQNRKTIESLKRLEPQTRLQQLCDLEAILQINRRYDQYAADFVIAYATEATVRKGDAVIAHGAAFHGKGRWYNLAFECQPSADEQDVARLRFKLGDAIPEERWAELNLPKAPANPLGGD